jgi:hypothetical protein
MTKVNLAAGWVVRAPNGTVNPDQVAAKRQDARDKYTGDERDDDWWNDHYRQGARLIKVTIVGRPKEAP